MPNAYGPQFKIYRKRNLYAFDFLFYLDGRDSVLQLWNDKGDNDNDAENGSTSGVDADDSILMPYGYSQEGAEKLTGNMGVDASTITAFTFGGVFVLNEITTSDSLLYGVFGDTHYPRIYCNGGTIYAELQLDTSVITLSTTLTGKVIPGQPFSVAVRGDIANGIDLLINEVEVDTDATTGTSFDTSTGDYAIGEDSNKSYNLSGAVRMVYALEENLTDAHLSTLRSMLDYEGYFDIVRDDLAKWSGDSSTVSIGLVTGNNNSPYFVAGNETV